METVTNSKQTKENNDCVVRAIHHAFGITYDEAHKFAEEKLDRKPRKGTFVHKYLPIFVKGEIFGKKIKIIGEKLTPNSNNKNRRPVTIYKDAFDPTRTIRCKMTVGQFIKRHPHGTYLVSVRKHMFCIRDGEVYGNSEDSKKLRTIVERAFKVEKI